MAGEFVKGTRVTCSYDVYNAWAWKHPNTWGAILNAEPTGWLFLFFNEAGVTAGMPAGGVTPENGFIRTSLKKTPAGSSEITLQVVIEYITTPQSTDLQTLQTTLEAAASVAATALIDFDTMESVFLTDVFVETWSDEISP